MKVLLIDPPFKRFTGLANYYFPLGLAYLAGAASNAGYEVTIYDADAPEKSSDINFTEDYVRMNNYIEQLRDDTGPVWDELERVITDLKPDVIGISALTTKIASAYKTSDHVRRIAPSLPVVMGGAHPTTRADEVLDYGSIDYVIRDEGEVAFNKLLKALSENNGAPLSEEKLSTIPNLSYRHGNKNRHNPSAPFVKELDTISFPSRSALLHQDKYSSEDLGVLLTSRGCPFRCSYCYHPWRGRVNFRSAENVIEEMLLMYHDHNVRHFAFKDDSFTAKRSHVEAICDAINKEKLKISWDCTTRPNIIDKSLLDRMVQAGCTVVKIGVETGSQRMLDILNRGTTFEQVRKAASLFNDKGIFWSGYFMMGLPQEREEDILSTLDLMRELRPYYAGLGVYEPFPNTVLFDEAVEMGLIHETVPVEHYFSTNPKDYFFVDHRRRVKDIEPERFEELTGIMMAEFHKHNTRLQAMLRRGWARRLAYKNDTSLLFNDIKKAIAWRSSG